MADPSNVWRGQESQEVADVYGSAFTYHARQRRKSVSVSPDQVKTIAPPDE